MMRTRATCHTNMEVNAQTNAKIQARAITISKATGRSFRLRSRKMPATRTIAGIAYTYWVRSMTQMVIAGNTSPGCSCLKTQGDTLPNKLTNRHDVKPTVEAANSLTRFDPVFMTGSFAAVNIRPLVRILKHKSSVLWGARSSGRYFQTSANIIWRTARFASKSEHFP